MASVYNNLQSHPYQKDQTHYRPPAMPQQMYINPPYPSTGHGYWPWASNYSHASPVACHGFCNHSYWPPNYAWGSPYSHVPPYHCPGSYPPYPVHYIPPPGWSAEPWYECEKSVPGVHHCCGCPNHPLHQKEQRSVRIEEEPDGDRERQREDSNLPSRLGNKPYPIVWLPPDYSSNKNGNKESLSDERPIENRRSIDAGVPNLWNGWCPLDLNRLALSKQGKDQEKNDNQQQDDDAKGHLPFPVVWMPYEPKQQEREEQSDQSCTLQGEKSNNLTASQVKDVPVMKVKQHEDRENSRVGDEGIDASGKGSISSRVKDIPVKEIGQHEEQKASDKNISDNREKKRLDNGVKNSTAKSSKLPPVCLRVDPLPKRASKRSPQRSPSPPAEKQKPNKASNEESKLPNSSVSKMLGDNIEKKGTGITKNIEVVDGKAQQGTNDKVHDEMPISIHVNCQQVPEDHKEDNTTSQDFSEPDGAVAKDQLESNGSIRMEDKELVESKERRTKKLSEEEAAVVIQSVFRGFNVRKWEPIKKLKQIAEIRKQIADVKNMIQSLESLTGAESESRQRCVIGEMLMSLLLKLDNIQGLHSTVREIRKSAVKELVNLQEELDSIKTEMPESKITPVQEQEKDGHQNPLTCEVEPIQAKANAAEEGSENVQMILEAAPDGKEEVNEKIANDAAASGMSEETATGAPAGIDKEGNVDDEVMINANIAESHGPEPLVLQVDSVEGADMEGNARGVSGNDRMNSSQPNPNLKEASAETCTIEESAAELCAVEKKEAPTSDEASVTKEDDIIIDDSIKSEKVESGVVPVQEMESAVVHEEECNNDGIINDSIRSEKVEPGVVPLQETEPAVVHEEECNDNQQDCEVNLIEAKANTAGEGSESIQMKLEYDPNTEEKANGEIATDAIENHVDKESPPKDPTGNDNEGNVDDKSLTPIHANTTEDEAPVPPNLQLASVERSNLAENVKLNTSGANPVLSPACEKGSQTMEESVKKMEAGMCYETTTTREDMFEHCDAADGKDSSGDASYQDPIKCSSRSIVHVWNGSEMEETAPNGDLNWKLMEAENQRLREMMEKLVKSGKEQVDAVSALTRRVKDLEKVVSSKKKKVKVRRCNKQ